MEYQDKNLTCKECENNFLFSADEQKFFAQKGFENEPARCQDCRKKKRQRIEKSLTQIKCAECGKSSKVNFKPNNSNPLWCRDCFEKIKDNI